MGERIAFAFLFAARRGNTRELAQSGNGKCTACTPGWVVMYNQQVRKRAGVVQWQYRSFPSFGRGFDSHRPLQKTKNLGRCLIFHFFQNLYKTTLFQSETVKRAFPDYY